jgi:hypothetical protein
VQRIVVTDARGMVTLRAITYVPVSLASIVFLLLATFGYVKYRQADGTGAARLAVRVVLVGRAGAGPDVRADPHAARQLRHDLGRRAPPWLVEQAVGARPSGRAGSTRCSTS